jgi:hypothetical protein
MKIFLKVLLLMFVSSSCFAWSVFGPKDYDECILENMKGVNNDIAAHAVKKSCREKFKQKAIDKTWTFINSNDEGSFYYNKSTIIRHGNIVTVEEMSDYNKRQSLGNDSFYSYIST